jgi:DNA-binding MarR family transcriptional regulator
VFTLMMAPTPGDDSARSATPENLVLLMRGLTRAVQQYLPARAKQAGLNPLDFLALVRVAEPPGMTGAQLAHALGTSSSAVTGIADRLQDSGLILREADPSDRRLVVLTATPEGRDVIERALGPLLTRLATIVDTFEPDERAIAARFMGQVADALGEATGARPNGRRAPSANSGAGRPPATRRR